MRILIITPSLPPAGGAEKVAWDLANALSNSNEIHILTFGIDFSIKKIDNLTIHFVKQKKHAQRYYSTLGKKIVKNIVYEIEPDVIHAHMPSILAYAIIGCKIRKILTLHNSRYEDYKKTLYQKLKFQIFTEKIIKKFDCVTTVSMRMWKYFIKYHKRDVVYVPNGINLEIFHQEKNILRNKKTVLYVGRLIKSKKISIIFKIANRLPDYNFIFVGNGPLLNSIDLPNIFFEGQKSEEELPAYYSKANYCIFPGEEENFPLVGLEAMACGSIVIAHQNGFSEYIESGKDGFLLSNTNVTNILKVLQRIEKSELKDMIRQNAMKKSKEYSWSKISEKYLELYNLEENI